MILKCKKCNNDLKESKFNKINSLSNIKAYRCINENCNALYDITDLVEKKEELSREEYDNYLQHALENNISFLD